MSEQSNGTVLIVDDEDDIRLALCTYARSLNLNVIEAANGEKAEEIVGSQVVDFIVSDLLMPKVGGIELLENLRAHGFYLPFIIVTGYSTKEFTAKALRLGAFDFLEKPFQGDQVKAIMKQAFEVSMRQKNIEKNRAYQYKNAIEHIKSDTAKKTASAILSLQSLRYAREEASTTPEESESFLRNMFFSEVQNHLISCRISIDALKDNKIKDHELAWIQRTMQTIQLNADSIGLPSISKLSDAIGSFCSYHRVYMEKLDENAIKLLRTVNEFLYENLDLLASEQPEKVNESIALIKDLEQLSTISI